MTLLSLFGGIRLGPPPTSHGHGAELQFAHCRRIMGCYCTDIASTWNEPRKPLCVPLTTSARPFALLHTSWGELSFFHMKIHIKSAHRDLPPTPTTTTWSTPAVYFGLPRLVGGSPGAAGLVGEAESGSRSQNAVSSLTAPLPVASVHQLRPIR